MNFKFYLISLLVSIIGCVQDQTDSRESVTPLPFNKVVLKDDFWKPRLETQVETLVPFALDKTIPAVENLEKTARFLKGNTTDLPFPHRYICSDLYKVMEGVAYLLQNESNPELEKRMDQVIDIIAEAQQEDGYLYVAHITGVSKDHDHWGGGGMGDKPYSFVLHSHELYNMGHMYEGAIAYYQATGKDKWLKVAEKSAQHINKVFFEGDPSYNDGKPVNQAPGHQELELALAKLYRVTGNRLYLDMAKKFLDIRGRTFVPHGEGVMSPSYAQQHQPVAEQRNAVGHAVRATYMYSGMADVGALTGSDEYDVALDSIWHNIVDTKISITGGLGAVHGIEGFGPEYVLPNKEAYNETCAAVGGVFFNFRMFLLTGDAKYMDIAEVSLLNNALAGVNMEGNRFFYVNPLEADGRTPFNQGTAGRAPWFGTACCPSNIARLMPQVAGMMYAYTNNEIYVDFYASSSAVLPLTKGNVKIEQESNYPFEGKVKLTLHPESNQKFNLKLRIPTWAGAEQFMPGELYDYVDGAQYPWSIKINGKKVETKSEKGFVNVSRKWDAGDVVELDIPMPVRFSKSIDKVEADKDRIAVTKGPLVYTAEGIDNGGLVQRFYLPETPEQSKVNEELMREGVLKNVVKIEIPAASVNDGSDEIKKIQLVPYYAWDNRGDGSMMVWLPTKKEMAEASMKELKRGEEYAEVKVSSNHQYSNADALSIPVRPSSSHDMIPRPWIGKDDNPQWVEIKLKGALQIRSIGIYWSVFEEMIAKPQFWKVQYLKDGKWKDMDIYVTDQYSTDMNKYNIVHPGSDLVTDRLRILVQPQKGMLAGILDIDMVYEN